MTIMESGSMEMKVPYKYLVVWVEEVGSQACELLKKRVVKPVSILSM
jgi:hypothetical protein